MRKRTAAIAGTFAALALVAVSANRANTVAPVVTAHRAATTCATPAPTTAVGYAAAFDALPDSQWAGADQATTVLLPSGRVLWLFADTVTINPTAMLRNTFVVQDRGCFRVIAQPLPNDADGSWYWPMSGAVINGALTVTAQRIHAAGSSFAAVGSVTFTLSATYAVTGRIELGGTAPLWGAAMVRAGSVTYMFGTQAVAGSYGRGMWLQGATAPLIPAVPGLSTTPSVWTAGGRWYALSKANEFLGSTLVTWSAPAPAGPWTLQSTRGGYASTATDLVYNPQAHPGLALASGGMLITVCHNNPSLAAVIANPALYRPAFVETPSTP